MKNGDAAAHIKSNMENKKKSVLLFASKYKTTFLLEAPDRLVPELGRCEFLVS